MITVNNRSRPSLISLALSTTALAGGLLGIAQPKAAWASCTTSGLDPVILLCSDLLAPTSTTNTINPLPGYPSPPGYPDFTVDRVQSGSVNLDGTVAAGVTVSQFGLLLEAIPGYPAPGSHSINMTNNGTVTLDLANALTSATTSPPGLPGPGALQLNGDGGPITLSGNGTVANNTSSGAGLLITNTGTGGISIGSAGAPIAGNFAGPIGIFMQTSAGAQTCF